MPQEYHNYEVCRSRMQRSEVSSPHAHEPYNAKTFGGCNSRKKSIGLQHVKTTITTILSDSKANKLSKCNSGLGDRGRNKENNPKEPALAFEALSFLKGRGPYF